MTTPGVVVHTVRIGLVDFEPIRATGLREILAARPEFAVTATDLTSAFQTPEFDLVIFLARRTAESYSLLARLKLRNPEMKVIVVAPESDDNAIMSAIGAGAKGWLEETASPSQVIQAVDIVLSGSIWAPRRVLSRMLDRALRQRNVMPSHETPRLLTEREEQVLRQLVQARSNREIGQALKIREQTVKSYVTRLMRKMGVDNRIALSVQAAEGEWLRDKGVEKGDDGER